MASILSSRLPGGEPLDRQLVVPSRAEALDRGGRGCRTGSPQGRCSSQFHLVQLHHQAPSPRWLKRVPKRREPQLRTRYLSFSTIISSSIPQSSIPILRIHGIWFHYYQLSIEQVTTYARELKVCLFALCLFYINTFLNPISIRCVHFYSSFGI